MELVKPYPVGPLSRIPLEFINKFIMITVTVCPLCGALFDWTKGVWILDERTERVRKIFVCKKHEGDKLTQETDMSSTFMEMEPYAVVVIQGKVIASSEFPSIVDKVIRKMIMKKAEEKEEDKLDGR